MNGFVIEMDATDAPQLSAVCPSSHNGFSTCDNRAVKHPIVLSVLVLTGAVIAVGVILWALGNDAESDGLGMLAVPATGVTAADTLDDGSPVFISTNLDGSVSVVAAVSTHLPDDPMGWCDVSRTIEDVPHGGKFNSRGQYLFGPAQTDLGTYEFTTTDSGQDVVVLAYITPTGRSADIQPDHPITQWCESPEEFLVHIPLTRTH